MNSNITAPKAEIGDTSPRIGGNHGSSARNIAQFPGMKTINKIDEQVENEQSRIIVHSINNLLCSCERDGIPAVQGDIREKM